MKKNRTMRAAVIMLALTLITSSFVGGTFAKYITTGEATDSARVAKWGVTVEAFDGSSFKTEYKHETNGLTVKSSTEDKLVAPGTADAEGVTFKISGTPEVATKVTVDMRVMNDVQLIYYIDFAGSFYYYRPVVYTLTHTYGEGAYSIAPAVDDTGAKLVQAGTDADRTDIITGTLVQIEKVLENLNSAMENNAPGYVYDDTFKLTWTWDFDDSGAGTNDVLDTVLGDVAAKKTVESFVLNGTTYNLYYGETDISYSISVSIEQID